MSRSGLILVGCAVLGLGLALRFMVPAGDFPASVPLPFPDDAPYHIERLKTIAQGRFDWPASLSAPDPGVAWPDGDTCIWPWGFDFLTAVTAPLDRLCGETCMINVAGMVPPIVSLLTAVLLGLAAGWRFSPSVGVAAAALFLFMPSNLSYSQVGRIDHHVMEPLSLTVPLVLLMYERRRLATSLPGGPGILACGFACGLAAAFFPAAPALAFPMFVACALLLLSPGRVAILSGGMLAGVAASLAVSPFPGDWTFHSPSLWHLFTTVCLSAGLMAVSLVKVSAHRILPVMTGRRKSAIAAWTCAATAGVTVAAASALLVALVFPQYLASFQDGVRYTLSSRFGALSLEAASFLDDPARLMTMSGWLLPFSAIGIIRLLRRIPCESPTYRRGRLFLAATSIGFMTLGAVQRRFLVAATPFIALTAAVGAEAIAGLASLAARKFMRSEYLAFAGLVTLMVLPSLRTDLGFRSLTPQDRAMYSAAAAVRREASLDATRPDAPADAGLFGPWGYGHLFKYASGTPTVCDNFFGVPGADRAIERCLRLQYSTDDVDISRQLNDLKIGFVVIAPPHPDQIRTETALLGSNPADWVSSDGSLTPLFARSFLGRTGLWAFRANAGERGPFNLVLVGKYRQIDPETGAVQSEAFVLKRVR